ncbi:SurA N-terminal domain-containing protein [Ramlibacter sp.]|uniref:SurA N-terminal domain-containing protein n=1 Tax=Ramlibacter sp. TaxID=1917967 RepID=UPI003D14B772
MFDFVRKHTRVMQFMLFILIVPSFVLFGLEGYNRFQEKGADAGKVDGRAITQAEWDNAHRNETERIRRQVPNIDAKLLDSPEAKYASLERLVHERVIASAAHHSKLVTSDQRLARELEQDQLIASLRGPDGKLDMARYRQLVSSQGMTPEQYENQIRADISGRQVLAGLQATAMPSAAPASVALGAYFEKREVQVARFNTHEFAAKVNPTDAELEAFYKTNPQLFQQPEQASIEYVVLDLDAVSKTVAVNEQDLKTYYEQNASRLAGKEERRASHILVAAPKTAPAAEREKAKAKAQQLLAEVKKNPASFADVAKKNSQDPGSAARGGDLDWFQRGAMTGPFDDAVFAMKKGEIGEVVETDFGYHIIQLTDLKAQQAPTFEQMRPQLEAELKKQQAQRKYAEAAETFSNGVYEQADTLKPVADKLKLEVRKADNVTRQGAGDAKGPLASSKFLTALFTPDSVEKKRNTEAMEFGPSQMVSGRIVQYTLARAKPFAEVKAQVREQVVAQRAAELAKKEGQEKLAAWKAAPASANAALTPAVVVSRISDQKLPRQVVEAALRADTSTVPAFVGVDMGAEGYAVVKVNKGLPRDASPPPQAQQEVQQYANAWTAAETLAYFNLLKERYKVQLTAPKPAEGAATTQ